MENIIEKFNNSEIYNESQEYDKESFRSNDAGLYRTESHSKGIVMIGPIPIIWGFGSRKNKALILIAMFLIYLVMTYLVATQW